MKPEWGEETRSMREPTREDIARKAAERWLGDSPIDRLYAGYDVDRDALTSVIRDALDACVAQTPRATTWQDIASAPKDGRAVLLFPSACWCNEDDRGEVAYWDKEADVWDRMGPVAVEYDGPTHWMPMPAAPVDLVVGEKKA